MKNLLILLFVTISCFVNAQNIKINVNQVNVARIYNNIKLTESLRNVNTTYIINCNKRQVIVSFNSSNRDNVVFEDVIIDYTDGIYTISYDDVDIYSDDTHVGTIMIDTNTNKVLYDDHNVNYNFSDVYEFKMFDLIVSENI
jgi:hypothetical protein